MKQLADISLFESLYSRVCTTNIFNDGAQQTKSAQASTKTAASKKIKAAYINYKKEFNALFKVFLDNKRDLLTGNPRNAAAYKKIAELFEEVADNDKQVFELMLQLK